jgi:hypothetical protein
MSNKDLQRYFKFDDSDLYANRSGKLSSKQKERLITDAIFTNRFFLT